MRIVRSLLAPVLAAALLSAVSVPVSAQERAWNIHGRMEQIAERIDRNESRGRLSHRDARHLREELHGIRDSEARMRRDGRLDSREREMLERRLSRLDARVTEERR